MSVNPIKDIKVTLSLQAYALYKRIIGKISKVILVTYSKELQSSLDILAC